jgi:hypothetical protein
MLTPFLRSEKLVCLCEKEVGYQQLHLHELAVAEKGLKHTLNSNSPAPRLATGGVLVVNCESK